VLEVYWNGEVTETVSRGVLLGLARSRTYGGKAYAGTRVRQTYASSGVCRSTKEMKRLSSAFNDSPVWTKWSSSSQPPKVVDGNYFPESGL